MADRHLRGQGTDGLAEGFDEAEASYESFLSGVERFRERYRDPGDEGKFKETEALQRAVEA